jgi:hypothetical protein
VEGIGEGELGLAAGNYTVVVVVAAGYVDIRTVVVGRSRRCREAEARQVVDSRHTVGVAEHHNSGVDTLAVVAEHRSSGRSWAVRRCNLGLDNKTYLRRVVCVLRRVREEGQPRRDGPSNRRMEYNQERKLKL